MTCTTLIITIKIIANKIAVIKAAWTGVAFFQEDKMICFKNRKKLNILNLLSFSFYQT